MNDEARIADMALRLLGRAFNELDEQEQRVICAIAERAPTSRNAGEIDDEEASFGDGSAGLPINDPMNRMLAKSTISVASAHNGSSTVHSGGSGGIARHAWTSGMNVAKATIE